MCWWPAGQQAGGQQGGGNLGSGQTEVHGHDWALGGAGGAEGLVTALLPYNQPSSCCTSVLAAASSTVVSATRRPQHMPALTRQASHTHWHPCHAFIEQTIQRQLGTLLC